MPRRKIPVPAVIRKGIVVQPRARKPQKQFRLSSAMPRDVNTPILERAMDHVDVEHISSQSDRRAMSHKHESGSDIFDIDFTAKLLASLEPAKKEKRDLIVSLLQVTEQLTQIKVKWMQGKIAMSHESYMVELRRGFVIQEDLMLRLFQLYSRLDSLNGLAANIVPEQDLGSTTFAHGYVVDTLNSFSSRDASFRNNLMLWRTEKQLIPFVYQVIKAYDCLRNTGVRPQNFSRYDLNTVPKYLCPITGEEACILKATVFHFVDDRLGAQASKAIFGHGVAEHIWNTANSLPIQPIFQLLLNEGKAVILPASFEPGETELMFYPLNRAFGAGKPHDLDHNTLYGRRLQFPNSLRPNTTHVLFRAVMTFLRSYRNEEVAHVGKRLAQKVRLAIKALWEMPGPPLKNAILYKVSRDVGCLTPLAANEFWGLGRDAPAPSEHLSPQDANNADALAVLVCAAVLQLGTPQAEYNGLEEEGDDDDIFEEGEEVRETLYNYEGLTEAEAASLAEVEEAEKWAEIYDEVNRNEEFRSMPRDWMY